MDQLDYYRNFVPKKQIKLQTNFEVWSYTRVSSKEQFDQNSSLERQKSANREYAAKNGYTLVEGFGETYESAKSDFTRKEFRRLIEKIEKVKRKPYAVLVYKMSRFSRSGGNAIGLVSYLVNELNVHLIEVSSGFTTATERGNTSILDSLFHAYKENLERKEIVIPNMKAYLKEGNRFSRAPIGYDHYGPKVRNEKLFSRKQKIVLNSTGKILKEAWQLKLSGLYSDVQILQKISLKGLKIQPQKISEIWRNPFYCGIVKNKLLDESVMGKWEAIVSIKDFIKVQNLLEKNNSGYQHKKEEEERPLTRLLKCNSCDGFMVGYKNNQKNLHYYRCLKCKGVSLNAKTTPKARRKSAEMLLIELLEKYQISEKIIPLVKLQLTKIFDYYNADSTLNEKQFEERLATLQTQVKKITIRFGLDEIKKETYEIAMEHLNEEILEINKELNRGNVKISNLEKMLAESLKKLENISKMWASSDFHSRRILHKTLFPEGIYYDVKNHQYLTRKVNGFIELVSSFSNFYTQNKNRKLQNNIEESGLVRESRLELPTFGL